MSGSKRLKRPDYFQALSVLGEMVAKPREPWSWVQVNKQAYSGLHYDF